MRWGCCAILVFAACYDPMIQGGAPCDPNTDSCPTGETCQARGGGNFCTGPGAGVDAGAGSDSSAVGDSCLGAKLLGSVCFAKAPTGAAMLTGTINTASTNAGNCTEIRPQPGGASLCIVAGATITVATGATVRAIGPNPLVLVAMHTIAIQGTIDASSHAGETVGGVPVIGAGARSAVECNAIGADGTAGMNGNGAGGAAGGSFGGAGGAGGNGKNGALHGNPVAVAMPTVLLGGCPGGHGGDGSGGGGGAAGGAGGGAVYLLARDSIAVSGKISASGGGGAGGTGGLDSSGAGGGGGSGGLIGLESAMLMVSGSIYANGGGGGGGGGDQPTNGGTAGGDSPTAAIAATGGSGGSGGGGAGGAGSTTVVTGTIGKPGINIQQCAGGGGGGGGGIIRLFGTPVTAGAAISPAAT